MAALAASPSSNGSMGRAPSLRLEIEWKQGGVILKRAESQTRTRRIRMRFACNRVGHDVLQRYTVECNVTMSGE